MLGYKPFFKEYTTDWDFAVAKMKGNFWTRRLVHNSYSSKLPWDEQVKLSSHPKPTNADYEYLVTDVTETTRKLGLTNGASNGSTNGLTNGTTNGSANGSANGRANGKAINGTH
jgi:hypothetical protein